jgi:hypothetical protein
VPAASPTGSADLQFITTNSEAGKRISALCFSPFASFATACLTGAVGIIALKRTDNPRELPLAATPIVFAVQQAIEGLQWLDLHAAPGQSATSTLTLLFLGFADVFWPIYAPAAVLLIEPNATRRRFMRLCLAAGLGVAAYLLFLIVARSPSAHIQDEHMVYVIDNQHPFLVGFSYLAATGLPLMLSSQRTVALLGAIVLVGSAIAFVAYWEAFVSVWCFFAAAASVAVLGHFEWARQRRFRAKRV